MLNTTNLSKVTHMKIFNTIVMDNFDKPCWIDLGNVTNNLDTIKNHPGLFKSLFFGDDNYSHHATDMLAYILLDKRDSSDTPTEFFNSDNLISFLDLYVVKEYIKENYSQLYDSIYENEKTSFQKPTVELSNQDDIIKILEDVDTFSDNDAPEKAIDRIHTAFHTHLKELCNHNNISFTERESITSLYKKIININQDNNTPEQIKKIQNSLSNIIHNLNELRNNNSLAHPNKGLLSKKEAWLAINSFRTIWSYLSDLHNTDS